MRENQIIEILIPQEAAVKGLPLMRVIITTPPNQCLKILNPTVIGKKLSIRQFPENTKNHKDSNYSGSPAVGGWGVTNCDFLRRLMI